jgi:hypothetical protein
MTLEFIATFCAALFAGASWYINLVEHPARMSLGAAAALAEWAPSYHRASWMQASLAIVGALAAAAASLLGSGAWWLVGGLLLAAVVPFTLVVIFPTNRELLDPATATRVERAGRLLARWNRLHAVRSLLGTASLVVFLALLP